MRRIISRVVQKLFGRRGSSAKPAVPPKAQKREAARAPAGPVVVKREEHTLSRTRIDEDALKVLNRLTRYNHTAYLVGGGVRDLLLDRPVKDFDIATSAHPQEIKNLFRNCRLIGRRFRLAHLLFRGKVIEVSTFRKHAGFSDEGELLIKSDNTFGTPEEDARRRDFTINGLFYSITDRSVIDYVGGLADLQRRVIRTIGDPNIRLREDPIRTLRAIRLAARLGFAIEPETRRAMTAHRDEIWKSAAPRIVDEFVRMLNQGAAAASFPLLAELDVLAGLLPGFARAYAQPAIREQVQRDLAALDAHQKPQAGLSAGLALAVLYYPLFAAATAEAGESTDHVKITAALLDADLGKLKFPRGQLEKAVSLLAAQHRLLQPPRRRGRSGPLAAKPWFAEAVTLFEITQADTPEGRAALRRLRALRQHGPEEARRGAEREEEEEAGAAGAAAPEIEAGETAAGEEPSARPPGRRRRSRRGRGGRGRRRAGEQAATEAPVVPAGREGRPTSDAVVAEPEEDARIDPDAAFGEPDSEAEPAGDEARTD